VIATSFEIPVEQISDSCSDQTIEQWDSVGHINLVMALEQEFGLSFTMEEIMHLRDIAAISKAIAEKSGRPAAA